MQTKQQFIDKWSNWWHLQKQGKELTQAFQKELDTLIDQEKAKSLLDNTPKYPFICPDCGHDPMIQVDGKYICEICDYKE
jgi:hypothetical protein